MKKMNWPVCDGRHCVCTTSVEVSVVHGNSWCRTAGRSCSRKLRLRNSDLFCRQDHFLCTPQVQNDRVM